MKIKLELELNDAMAIIAAFSPNSKIKESIKEKGEIALEKMSKQIDETIEALSSSEELCFY